MICFDEVDHIVMKHKFDIVDKNGFPLPFVEDGTFEDP